VRRDSRGAAGSAGSEVGKKKGRGEGEADRQGPGVGVCKEKEKEAVRWAAAGWFGGPAGRAGPKGKKGLFSFFSFLLFQTPFETTFLFKFKPNSFKLFLRNFINFLETTQATKNHASQLMMHNHLLSLYLLNYV
jgi:hypothetical protein